MTGSEDAGSLGTEHAAPVRANAKASRQLRAVEWVVRAKEEFRPGSRHLWILTGLMAALGYIYYGVVHARHDVFAVLFSYPVMYAAVVFRLRGAAGAWLVSIAILAPYAALYATDAYSAAVPFLVVSLGFLVGSLVAAQLNYLERQLEAYDEILALNAELTGYIERLEKTQRQLIQAEKLNAMGRLAASVAHEINNPLAGALVYCKLLQKRLGGAQFDRQEALTNLVKVEAAIAHCSAIVRGLLDYARQSPPALQPSSVSSVIDRVMSLVGHQAEMKHVRVIRDNGPGVPQVMADPGQLQQVFTNLVLNAIEAMPDGGDLAISSSLGQDHQVIVSFRDTGRGIPPEDLPRLFTPFYTTKEKGIGLGLAVSAGIVERHGGRIEVASAMGKGTTFTVRLPALVNGAPPL